MGNSIPNSKEFSRRTIVKGAAWSVPVIAMSTAAPAFAASTRNNLKVETVDCELITLGIAGSNFPGFRYTVTEGIIKKGTQIQITFGGLAAINAGNFELGAANGISLLNIGGNVATFELTRDYLVGENFTIGLKGFSVNIVGLYTSRIITPDAVQDDNIAIMTAGGVGVGSLLGAFICFDSGDDNVPPVTKVDYDIQVSIQKCQWLTLGSIPTFRIGVVGGTIPQGTTFIMYGSSVATLAPGSWNVDGSVGSALDILGTGSNAWTFRTPRDITPSTPLDVKFTGVGIFAAQTWYLAYLGEDINAANNAAGMQITGVTLGFATVATCQKQTS